MISNFPAVINFNQLVLKLTQMNRFSRIIDLVHNYL